MTRDEVLKYLTNLADEYASALESIEGSESKLIDVYGERVKAFRAAAEIIRESGWRPIAEAPLQIPAGKMGWWGRDGWISIPHKSPFSKLSATALGYTHYLPDPAPPARKASDGRA